MIDDKLVQRVVRRVIERAVELGEFEDLLPRDVAKLVDEVLPLAAEQWLNARIKAEAKAKMG